MRIIAPANLATFSARHPETVASLKGWAARTRAANWETVADVQAAFPKSKALNGERVRFEIAGGNYRLIVAFDFRRGIVFIKFLDTHAEYDRVDALTVSQF